MGVVLAATDLAIHRLVNADRQQEINNMTVEYPPMYINLEIRYKKQQNTYIFFLLVLKGIIRFKVLFDHKSIICFPRF